MSPLPWVKSPDEPKKPVVPAAAAAPATLEGSPLPSPQEPSKESWAVLAASQAPVEVTPSASSESVSLVTQIANPASVPDTQLETGAQLPVGPRNLSQRLLEATAEEPKPTESAHPPAATRERAASSEQAGLKELAEGKPPVRTETLREDGPTDLRVFELNSDSGKSTPSNNGKKGGCTGPGSAVSTEPPWEPLLSNEGHGIQCRVNMLCSWVS